MNRSPKPDPWRHLVELAAFIAILAAGLILICVAGLGATEFTACAAAFGTLWAAWRQPGSKRSSKVD